MMKIGNNGEYLQVPHHFVKVIWMIFVQQFSKCKHDYWSWYVLTKHEHIFSVMLVFTVKWFVLCTAKL